MPFVFLYAGVWGTVGALIVFLSLHTTRVFHIIAVVTSLADIEQRLFEACRRRGRQTDDPTIRMVRVGLQTAPVTKPTTP